MNDDIYNQQLKALAKSNHGNGELSADDTSVTLDNPLCGDRVKLSADVNEGRIVSVIHNVKGCLLCQASASAIGAMAPGIKTDVMLQVCDHMAAMFNADVEYKPLSGWEGLAAFEPVKSHRNRHNCVLLPFQAIAKILNDDTSK